MSSLRSRLLDPPPPRPFLVALRPPELRAMIYEHLFSELPTRQKPPVIEYHLCDKTYEVTTRFQRMTGQPSIPGPTSILRTCREVYEEALPLLYQQAKIVVTLRAAPYSLDLSGSIAKQLRLVGSLELIVSSSFPCIFPPHPEGNDTPKVVTRPRRASWNGQPSSREENVVTKSPKPSIPARTRRQYWESFMGLGWQQGAYRRRLDALLGVFSNGCKLKHVTIFIENMEYRMDPVSLDTILRRMEARLRVPQDGFVALHLDQMAEPLVTSIQKARFLVEIQP